jgi:hypothetical protein
VGFIGRARPKAASGQRRCKTWRGRRCTSPFRTIKLSFLGIPEEGVGFSADAPIRIGALQFSDAALQLTPRGGQLALRLQYFE